MAYVSADHRAKSSLAGAVQASVARPRTGTPVVYFLRLKSGIVYIGATLDLTERLSDHFAGRGCRTTSLDPPLALLRVEVCSSFSGARRREAQLKRWSRAKKEALVVHDAIALHNLARSREDDAQEER